MRPRLLALLLTAAGLASLVAGVALVYVPAAFMVGGLSVAAIGLFARIDGGTNP